MKENTTSDIHFHYLTKPFYFPRRTELKRFLHDQLTAYNRGVDTINFVFCDDRYLLGVNKSYLNHDTFTDIITFELSEKGMPLLSDVFISVERVRENARDFGVSFLHELLRVVFHGILHLLGFNDKKRKDKLQMRRLEDDWYKAFCST